MGTTTFSGPIRAGKDTGAEGTTTIGTTVLQQECTVVGNTSGAQSVVLPANAGVQGFSLIVRSNASADAVAVRIGNGDDVDYFGQINASAAGLYDIADYAVSAASFFNVGASSMQVYVDVTALASAIPAGFDAILRTTYIQR